MYIYMYVYVYTYSYIHNMCTYICIYKANICISWFASMQDERKTCMRANWKSGPNHRSGGQRQGWAVGRSVGRADGLSESRTLVGRMIKWAVGRTAARDFIIEL